MRHAGISNLVAAVGVKPFIFERGAWERRSIMVLQCLRHVCWPRMGLVYRIERALVRLRLVGGYNGCYAGLAFSAVRLPSR